MAAQPRNGHDNSVTTQMAAAGEVGRQICEPSIKAMAYSGAELLSLASRRAQAYMELPARIGACRSPQELMAEQARFAQMAWAHYSECCTRMMTACQTMAPQTAGLMEIWGSAMRAPMSASMIPAPRDYLDNGEDSSELKERRQGQPRRAA